GVETSVACEGGCAAVFTPEAGDRVLLRSPASMYLRVRASRLFGYGAQLFSPLGPSRSPVLPARTKHSACGIGFTFATKFLFAPEATSSGRRSSFLYRRMSTHRLPSINVE